MKTRKVRLITGIITLIIILQTSSTPALGFPSDDGNAAIHRVRDVLPASLQMIDETIAILSKGLSDLTPEEHELFQRFFDPGNTGEIDENYLQQVIDNYRRIKNRLSEELTLDFAPNSRDCYSMRLFYTDFIKVHICPYILVEANPQRIARDLVHEVAHMAWLVYDREYYYSDTYQPYQQMTPRGHPEVRIPIIGRIVREILRNDTLFNPDTYSTFTAQLTAIH